MKTSDSNALTYDDIIIPNIKKSPTIKRENLSPFNRVRRRLKQPVILNSNENGAKIKRSRLSSPVVVENDNTERDSRSIKLNYSQKREQPCSPGRRRPSHEINRRRTGGETSVPDGGATWGQRADQHPGKKKPENTKPKEQPNFELSGKLAADTNTFKGVVIKYNEPDDARKPATFWRLYPFKGQEALKVMHIHRQSGYLIGSSRHIADLPMLHPSISKQHAVLQFRFTKGRIRLYVIDLESTNGTFLNNKKIEPRRYYEVYEKDVLKFGFSTREYVAITDKTDTGSGDDDEDVPKKRSELM